MYLPHEKKCNQLPCGHVFSFKRGFVWDYKDTKTEWITMNVEVIATKFLSSSLHIYSIVKNLTSGIHLQIHKRLFRSLTTLGVLQKSLVQPISKNGSENWSPYQLKQVIGVNGSLRKFFRLIGSELRIHLPYHSSGDYSFCHCNLDVDTPTFSPYTDS